MTPRPSRGSQHGRPPQTGVGGLSEGGKRPQPALIAAAAILLAAVVRLPTLAFPMTETHPFRQTQTAFPAVIYAQEGIDLLRPQVPVFGPPWVLPFEFPIAQALGSVLIRAGLTPEVAMRGVALTSFLATALLLWALLRRNVNERTALVALLVFVASPFSLLFSRAALIEFPATFGAVAFVFAVLEWHRTGRRRWIIAALAGGGWVALVKLTTAVFWIAPALLTRRSVAISLVTVPAALGLAWAVYADGIRGAGVYSAFLVSSELTEWLIGGNRLDLGMWMPMLSPAVITAGMLLTPFIVAVAARPERLVWLWMGIAVIAPLVVFTNLYARHDYYFAAVTPALAALVGGGVDRALQWRPALRLIVVTVPVISLAFAANYWMLAYRPADGSGVLAAAKAIQAQSNADDLVVTITADWSPAGYFYAKRRGVILQRDVMEAWSLSVPAGGTLVDLP